INSNLTVEEVNDIIESSARKVGGYNYTTTTGRTNGTWDDEVGYGLLDAKKAVDKAIQTLPTINGPSMVCASNTVYTLSEPVGPATVLWNVTPNMEIVSYTNSSVTVKWFAAPGPGAIKATINGFTITKDVTVGPAPLNLDVYPD